ncbi:hypothetical protein O3M35_001688 [Rhynocoris fuscipes]|uniref:TPX2 C-terminal domain-containing protein n=1 Tax=Rhynocoris fuscipes TaxID=488301 RepID=A0AAW1CPT9_9HEMI
MDEKFDFAAPQFLESLPEAANLAEQDGADSFFDAPSVTPSKCENTLEETIKIINNEETIDDNKENQSSTVENCERQIKKAKRLLNNKTDIKNPKVSRNEKHKFDGIEVVVTPEKEKEHSMMTRQDKILKTPTLELRARKIIKEASKRKGSPSIYDPCFGKRHASQFMSLAEKVMHFQVDTPPRFKTKIPVEDKEKRAVHLMPTIPQSPKLMTKLRARPHDNKNEEEPENALFKATKLNMRVFEKPNTERPKPKSPTVQKPFKLTEVVKKEPIKEEIFQFKARPMPKWLSGSCDSLNSSISSTCSRRSRRKRNGLKSINEFDESLIEDENVYSGMSSVTKSNHSTRIKPFSFDERDKELLKKKEEKIKMLQEEAKKVPEFHATPLPSFISNTSMQSTLKSSVSTTSLISETGSTQSEPGFKAKFPSVLYKDPFIPQKPERPVLQPAKFELNTEKRARDRQEFEKELKLKEERWEEEKKQVMALLEQQEKEELAELRKKLVHKAQPVPSFISKNNEND